MKRYEEGTGADVECFTSIRISGTLFYLLFPQDRKEGLSPLVLSFLLGRANLGAACMPSLWLTFIHAHGCLMNIDSGDCFNRVWGISHLISELRWGMWHHFNSQGTGNYITASFMRCLKRNPFHVSEYLPSDMPNIFKSDSSSSVSAAWGWRKQSWAVGLCGVSGLGCGLWSHIAWVYFPILPTYHLYASVSYM